MNVKTCDFNKIESRLILQDKFEKSWILTFQKAGSGEEVQSSSPLAGQIYNR